MSIPSKVMSKIDPGSEDGPKKMYYMQATSRSMIDQHELAQEISSFCTASPADVMLILESLSSTIPRMLMDGYSVSLGDLGIFSAHLSSRGHKDPKKVTSKFLKKVTVAFRPSSRFKSRMKYAEVSKVYVRKKAKKG
ncbi:MAG: HU family DNA-binding protein [Bacteroidota bacterium]